MRITAIMTIVAGLAMGWAAVSAQEPDSDPGDTGQDVPGTGQVANTRGPDSQGRLRSRALDPDPEVLETLNFAASSNVSPMVSEEWGDNHRGTGPAFVGPPGQGCDFTNLQDAMDAAESGGAHHIGVHQDYEFSQSYSLNDPYSWSSHPWIVGGFSTCDPTTSEHSTQTTLDAAGSGRVFTINAPGSDGDPFRRVRLDRLVLTGGDSVTEGAGLRVRGQQGRLSVELLNVDIQGNSASLRGGGLYVITSGDSLYEQSALPPLVFMDDESWVTDNLAGDIGGGIRCFSNHSNIGGAVLRTGSGLVTSNEAEFGGGVAISGCIAVLRNGSPLFFLAPVAGIGFNTATESGGGVHASDGATVSISSQFDEEFGGDPESAALVMANEAKRGGGIYAVDEGTSVFMFRSAVLSNTANEVDSDGGFGGGVYVDEGASLTFLALEGDGPCLPVLSGAVTTVQPCNRLNSNVADAGGGGAFVANAGSLVFHRGEVRGNQSDGNGAAIFARNAGAGDGDPESTVVLTSSLITGNEGNIILYTQDGGVLESRWSTVVDNPYTSSLFRAFAGPANTVSRIDILSSIVWDDQLTGGLATRGGDGDTTMWGDCIIGFQDPAPSSFTTLGYYSHIDPEFANPEDDNYRLSLTSPAINYCDDFNEPPERDKDDRFRDFEFEGDTTEPPESFPGGIFDLGAYVAPSDDLFQDRFESD